MPERAVHARGTPTIRSSGPPKTFGLSPNPGFGPQMAQRNTDGRPRCGEVRSRGFMEREHLREADVSWDHEPVGRGVPPSHSRRCDFTGGSPGGFALPRWPAHRSGSWAGNTSKKLTRVEVMNSIESQEAVGGRLGIWSAPTKRQRRRRFGFLVRGLEEFRSREARELAVELARGHASRL